MSLQGSLDRIECLFSKDMKREILVGLKRITMYIGQMKIHVIKSFYTWINIIRFEK